MSNELVVRLYESNDKHPSGSSVLLGKHDDIELWWGTVYGPNGSTKIVNVRIGTLSLVVEESIMDLPLLLKALHNRVHHPWKKADQQPLPPTDPTDPAELKHAIEAAMSAHNFELAVSLSLPAVLNHIADIAIQEYIRQMTPERMLDLLNHGKKLVQDTYKRGFQDGIHATKRAFREWLEVPELEYRHTP